MFENCRGVFLMFWFLLGCTEVTLPTGEWLAGDLHVHSSVGSDDTDGKGSIAALAPAMQRWHMKRTTITFSAAISACEKGPQ